MIPITLTDLHMYLMGCECGDNLFTSGDEVLSLLKEMVERSGLEALKTQHHDFEGGGTTAVVLLAESHVAIHTWPETNHLVVVDISVCNYTADNSKKTHHLKDLIIKAFKPTSQVIHEADPTPRVLEYNCPGMAYYAEIEKYIEQRRTKYQEMILFQNRSLGKVLVLDDLFQTSEKDEFFYHEAIIHPAMLTHKEPESVLILGGGDLGAAEEALKYPSVKRLLQIDIDKEVVELCMTHLTGIHHDCYKDSRFEITYEDGYEFMKRENEKFDVLIMDLTDPVGVCQRLYTEEFYQNVVANRMKEGAFMALHQGFPFTLPDRSRRIHRALRQVFADVKSYSNFVPLYGDSMLYALCGSQVNLLTPDEADRKIEAAKLQDMNYISGESYQALFGLPLYIRRLLEVG
ncbi:MAG: polyamine aminopropyltransferase [Planctomycetota bacterium]|jgi:spermidine synthase